MNYSFQQGGNFSAQYGGCTLEDAKRAHPFRSTAGTRALDPLQFHSKVRANHRCCDLSDPVAAEGSFLTAKVGLKSVSQPTHGISARVSRVSAILSLVSLILSFYLLQDQMEAKAAAGVLSILAIHEVGHLALARYFKVPVLWPIFVPGNGACIVMLKKTKDSFEQAWIGLGGPLFGVASTIALHCAGVCCHSEWLLSVAFWGYSVHLINLIPAGSLDGGHVAGFVGRWLFVPGAIILFLVIWCAERLSMSARILFGLLLAHAFWCAASFLAEKLGLKDAPQKNNLSDRSRRVVWLVFLCLIYVCAGGAILANLQTEALMIRSLETPQTSLSQDYEKD